MIPICNNRVCKPITTLPTGLAIALCNASILTVNPEREPEYEVVNILLPVIYPPLPPSKLWSYVCSEISALASNTIGLKAVVPPPAGLPRKNKTSLVASISFKCYNLPLKLTAKAPIGVVAEYCS